MPTNKKLFLQNHAKKQYSETNAIQVGLSQNWRCKLCAATKQPKRLHVVS